MARHTGSKRTAGGLSKEPFFTVFNNIRSRITDPSHQNYSSYGGRGLTFEWKGYVDFKKDMYASYLRHKRLYPKNTTIERIDNNKGYSKENCRWATFQEQAKNKRTSRYLTYRGRTLIIADWARELGVSRQAVRHRIEAGWDVKSVIETPFDYANKYDRKTKTVATSGKNNKRK